MGMTHCGPHGRGTGMLGGLVLIAVGVLWWLTNTDVVDGKFWDWLLPLLVILCGLACLAMPMCGCAKCKAWKEGGGCKDGSCGHEHGGEHHE
ncbi:MAG: hypothetical protein HYZ08_01030 [Candidatus Kerfeldbacteria bacterium]|nr:hypothetical protein [Candidatus Kerfeldbacteria bacterium]